MKKIIFLSATFLLLCLIPITIYAVEATATPDVSTSSATPVDDQVKNLKERIANKVAELTKKEKKSISGIIIKIQDKTISFQTVDEQLVEVKIDDTLTKFYSVREGPAKEIKFSDLKKGDYIWVNGPKIDKYVNANYVVLDDEYLVKTGKVTQIEADDYYFKVSTSEKDDYTLDFETYTKTMILNIKTLDLGKSGFSKIKEGDTVHIVVKKTGTEKEKNRYPAQKILIIPQEYFIK